jgi:hypothetical protein
MTNTRDTSLELMPNQWNLFPTLTSAGEYSYLSDVNIKIIKMYAITFLLIVGRLSRS